MFTSNHMDNSRRKKKKNQESSHPFAGSHKPDAKTSFQIRPIRLANPVRSRRPPSLRQSRENLTGGNNGRDAGGTPKTKNPALPFMSIFLLHSDRSSDNAFLLSKTLISLLHWKKWRPSRRGYLPISTRTLRTA